MSSWAIVTGASGGLGAAFTRSLAKRGFSVLAVARRVEPLARMAEELQKDGACIETLAADLASAEGDVAPHHELGAEVRGLRRHLAGHDRPRLLDRLAGGLELTAARERLGYVPHVVTAKLKQEGAWLEAVLRERPQVLP